MERRLFVRGAGIAGVLAAGTAPAIVQAQATIRWRLASSFPKALDTIFGAADEFAKQVSAHDRRQVHHHHPCRRRTDARRSACSTACPTAPSRCAHTAPYYFFGKDPTFALDCAIPFGLNSRQMTAWMFEGNGLKLMREFYAKVQHRQLPDGQHRRADGRLVPQGDQVAGRHEGPEDPHRRLRRQGAREASAACRRTSPAARSTRRWKRAPSTRPNGWARTTT